MKLLIMFGFTWTSSICLDLCFTDIADLCNNESGTPTDLPNCQADLDTVHGITSKIELLVSSHIFKSFEYLFMSFTYSSSTKERPGLQKLFKKQSDSLWNNAVHLIQFISQRGGILNFSEPTSNKEDDLSRLNFGELEDLAHALDMEKTLERQAIYIHRELANCQRGSFNSEVLWSGS